MIASMTGFGRGSAQVEGVTAAVEMRSVNNRFLDVVVRLPQNLAEHEPGVQALVRQAFERGRINVNVQVEKDFEADLPIQVNEKAARAYGRLLEDLRQAAGIQQPPGLEHVIRYADVFITAEEDPETTARMWMAVEAALSEAIEQMHQMRLQEGRALQADFEARIDALEACLARVEERAPGRVQDARERLRERLNELLGDARIDPERLEQEITLYADRVDVTEECVRLHSHLDLFRQTLAGREPVGRKLNFLMQEIHREVNTISSKANDAQVAHLAVEMKEEVEKIREQIQNVE